MSLYMNWSKCRLFIGATVIIGWFSPYNADGLPIAGLETQSADFKNSLGVNKRSNETFVKIPIGAFVEFK